MENESWWRDDTKTIECDFKNVNVMGATWTAEFFCYYLLNFQIKKAGILNKIICVNLSKTKKQTITREIEDAY